MTKKKTAGPVPVTPRSHKKRTGTLPGIDIGDPELNSLARVYVDHRDERMRAGLAEKEAKDELLSAMDRKKKTSYRYDAGDEFFEISVEAKDATKTLKVKVTSKSTGEEDGE